MGENVSSGKETTVSHGYGEDCMAGSSLYNLSERAWGQMDTSSKTDFEAEIVTKEKAITTFYEAAAVEEGTSSRPTFEMSTYIENNDDIKSFFY